ISYTIVLIFLFFFLLLIVAWPFLKILTLGKYDRLARRDVILLCLAAVLTAALTTFFVADLYRYSDLEQRLDAQLSNFASDIKCRFQDDVGSYLMAANRFRKIRPTRRVLRQNDTIDSIEESGADDDYQNQIKKALLDGEFFQ